MINVILVCNQGISTNIMKKCILDAANKVNTKMSAEAISLDNLKEELNKASIIILGPQLRYALDQVKEMVKKSNMDIPVFVMNSTDFGLMRGDNVYQQIMHILNK